MNYKETLETLYNMLPDFQNIGAGAYKPGLERAIAFNKYLGSPDRAFATVHIAGTNGKGSVSHMLASILQQAGYRTGLYTSPHLLDFRERIKVDGEMIPEQYVIDFTSEHLDKMRSLEMSFFEATMGMAFRYFADCGVEVAVIETGLGGRLDSTNILTPEISVITNIGMDHMAFLGDTPEQIASEKAGIIKPGIPVVIGESDPHSAPIFIRKAQEQSSPIVFADQEMRCVASRISDDGKRYYTIECIGRHILPHEIGIDLLGDYQCKNVITTLATVEALNKYTHISVSSRAEISGCSSAASSTGLRGRWQIIGHNPRIILDAGHNPHGLKQTMEQLSKEQYDKLYFILGIASDKDIDSMLALLPQNAEYIFTQASVDRAMKAEDLSKHAHSAGLHGKIAPSVAEAMKLAKDSASPADMIFIGGSCFVIADALAVEA